MKDDSFPDRSDLRARAEAAVRSQKKSPADPAAAEVEKVIHELTVHQAELEMQNEELRRAQTVIEESRSKYSDLYDFSPVGYFSVNREGVILEANLTAATLLGQERSVLIGKPISLFVAKEHRDDCFLHLRKVLATGQRQLCELPMEGKNGGRFWTRLESVPHSVKENEQQQIWIVVLDVSAQKRNEEQSRIARKHAEDANRSKSEFLANMSHEFRTPMTIVMGMLDISMQKDIPDDVREFLSIASRSAHSLLRILNEVLDFASIEAGRLMIRKSEFDPQVIAENIAESLAMDAQKKGLELVCHITPDVPGTVLGDANRIAQVIVNLLNNAVKFTERGEVCLKVWSTVEAEKTKERHYLHFAVSDTGPGIPDEESELLFESFRQLDGSLNRKHGGTGLGLAISKRIVESMGGKIWAGNQPDGGSMFQFTVPVDVVRQSRHHGLERLPAGIRVLAVVDNSHSRRALQDAFTTLDARVDFAGSGPEALEVCQEGLAAGDPVRTILIDSSLPGESGAELAASMREDPGIAGHVFLMTDLEGSAGQICTDAEVRPCDVLIKPVKISSLRGALSQSADMATATEKSVPSYKPSGAGKGAGDGVPWEFDRTLKSILIVEDDDDTRRLFDELLGGSPWQVKSVGGGREAVEAVKKRSYDLVLMDMQMPDMDGLTATKAIRNIDIELGRYTPIIALTAHAREEDRQRCMMAGMDDFMTKPVQPHAFEGEIRRRFLARG